MTRQERIIKKLTDSFAPSVLEVKDVSSAHHGHGGWRPEGETHFEVVIACGIFADKTRLAAHRLVNDVLIDEFDAGLHALQIKILKE